jgi:hypothetical protein
LGYGEIAHDQKIQVENFEKDKTIAFPVDLSPALVNGVGQVAIVILPTQSAYYPNNWTNRPIVKAWIQVTYMGVTVKIV